MAEASTPQPLVGCRVGVTRERPGRLGDLLAAAGATIVHVPLIEVVDTAVERAAVEGALARPEVVDWVLVTSAAGAERVAPALAGLGSGVTVRLGAVGSATARRLSECTGAAADLVPDRQTAAHLAERFVELHRGGRPQRVVIAQADRAAGELGDLLRSAGHEVVEVTAYRTLLRRPSRAELRSLERLDAVVFASGSAARSWADALDDRAATLLPDIVIAIGPSTATTAEQEGLKVTATCADHSVSGVVDELTTAWRSR